MNCLKISTVLSIASFSFSAFAMDLYCENNRLYPLTFVSYKVHLGGEEAWNRAYVSLTEGNPPQPLPHHDFNMPCQKDDNGDIICVLNAWNGQKYDQTVFRWHGHEDWNDEITLSFNIGYSSVSYRCHE